jgi:hypothetical protein
MRKNEAVHSRSVRGFRVLRICALALLAVSGSLWLAWAAQSTFTQSDWSNGIPATSGDCTTAGGTWSGTECLATSPNYKGYSVKDAGIVAGTDIQLQPTDYTAVQTSDTAAAASNYTATPAGWANFRVSKC